MVEFINNDRGEEKLDEVKTFSVAYPLENLKGKIIINTFSKASQEKLINKALNFHLQGNIKEAAIYYRDCINIGIKEPKIFSNYGIILRDLGKLKEAESYIRKAIQINPNFANAHLNLGSILQDLGNFKEAESSTRKAINFNPNLYRAHYNLGQILYDTDKFEEAEVSLRKAIQLKADFAEAHYNLALLLKDRGKLKEAELSIRTSIQIKPHYSDAYSLLSFIQLLKGKYHLGLENYEFRFKTVNPHFLHANPIIKKIDINNLKKGEKTLVVSEQGLGDTLQYMRYIPYLRNQGFDIAFCAQEKLHALIKSSGIDLNPLTSEQANIVSDGQWIPLLSIPRYLQINPKNPIISKPYIFSTNELNNKWKKILSKENKPIVGINWQGNQDMEKKLYKGRSLPLENFSILLERNDIKILSLQKGFGSEQLANCSFKNKFVDCQPQIDCTWNFLENAAIIDNCDLIITCDTSIAHLAGGMGKKVWLLLRDIPFWTWGYEGETTFWYQSIRLFRQKERNNWKEVLNRVSNQLESEFFQEG